MKWNKVISPNDLHKGMRVAFTTVDSTNNNVIELWNEQFTVNQVLPNTQSKVELWLNTKEGENLVVYWNEIEELYTPSI